MNFIAGVAMGFIEAELEQAVGPYAGIFFGGAISIPVSLFLYLIT